MGDHRKLLSGLSSSHDEEAASMFVFVVRKLQLVVDVVLYCLTYAKLTVQLLQCALDSKKSIVRDKDLIIILCHNFVMYD